ncbi:hypothetical protein NY751_03190 [Xanthomonas campestris]|nr:hypothetical protein [Xanthomonas campestris]MDC8745112.1 hypothetical protein [Xanthomonas campestris]
MKTTLVISLLLGRTAASGLAQAARYVDANGLSAAASCARFKSGTDVFRMLPGSVVAETLPSDEADAPSANATGVAFRLAPPNVRLTAPIGPYAIVLDNAATAAHKTAATDRALAVAVNERTGRAALVNPQLKLTGTDPATATTLADATAGSVVNAITIRRQRGDCLYVDWQAQRRKVAVACAGLAGGDAGL